MPDSLTPYRIEIEAGEKLMAHFFFLLVTARRRRRRWCWGQRWQPAAGGKGSNPGRRAARNFSTLRGSPRPRSAKAPRLRRTDCPAGWRTRTPALSPVGCLGTGPDLVGPWWGPGGRSPHAPWRVPTPPGPSLGAPCRLHWTQPERTSIRTGPGLATWQALAVSSGRNVGVHISRELRSTAVH